MWTFLPLLVAILLVRSGLGQYTPPEADFEVLPEGLKISIPDETGITLVAYHLNVNDPLAGTAAGQYNIDVTSPTDGEWSHIFTEIQVTDGDVIYYWIHVIKDGAGYDNTDLQWEVDTGAGETTTEEPQITTTGQPDSTTEDQGTTSDPGTTNDPGTTSDPGTTDPGVTDVPTTKPPPGTTITTVNGEIPPGVDPGDIVFDEEFDTLDFVRWQHEITAAGGGNWEFQIYYNNRSNSYIRDGVLYIRPNLVADVFGEEFVMTGHLDMNGGAPADECTNAQFWGCLRDGDGTNIINPIYSARLRTVNSFHFRYGKVEVRAKMPAGDWLWPAIWMLPRHNVYGVWPQSGELDICEVRGNRDLSLDGTQIGLNQFGQTLHFGPFYEANAWPTAHFEKNLDGGAGFDEDFHRFQVEWMPEYIKFGMDDEEIGTITVPDGGFWEQGDFDTMVPGVNNPWANATKNAPFDQEYYIILNLAVGGTGYFPDEAVNGGPPKPWTNDSPQATLDFWMAKNDWYPTWNPDVNNGEDAAMKVDYVKVWAV